VAGPAAGLEGLDDDHAAAAAGARGGEHGLRSVIGGRLVLGIGGGTRRDFQKLAGLRDALVACAAGEKAIVADAMEALGQDVEEESADELSDACPGQPFSASVRSCVRLRRCSLEI
jgi:hypothetical protein